MFAMGGNAEAVLSGLASDEQCRKIFAAALARQAEFKMSTIGGALLPPYPKGIFKHPMVDDPYEYQNGGLWDWFGAKLVRAMFERGSSRTARDKLLEIAPKNVGQQGLLRMGRAGRPGPRERLLLGKRGEPGLALVEGYFGVRLDRDGAASSSRSSERTGPGQHPRSRRRASMPPTSTPGTRRRRSLRFRFESDVKTARDGEASPPAGRSPASRTPRRPPRRKESGFPVERRGDEIFLVLETDFATTSSKFADPGQLSAEFRGNKCQPTFPHEADFLIPGIKMRHLIRRASGRLDAFLNSPHDSGTDCR